MSAISPKQLAARWGCSPSWIYGQLKKKHDPLPGRKLGGWAIDPREAEMWADRQQQGRAA